MNSKTRIAVITGGNRGLGFEICRQLGKYAIKIIFTARSSKNGEKARLELEKQGIDAEVFVMDVRNSERVKALADHLQTHYGGLDILVNNAAIAKSTFDQIEVVHETIDTNVFAVIDICEQLLPLMRKEGCVVMVSSSQGFRSFLSPLLRSRFDRLCTVNDIHVLMKEFVQDVLEGKHEQKGWPPSTYRVSKLALNKLTQILGDDFKAHGNPKKILINAVDPGWINTEMGGANAPKTVEEGADTPVWLTLLKDEERQGDLYLDRQRVDW
jgi:carbonyl reductase 1